VEVPEAYTLLPSELRMETLVNEDIAEISFGRIHVETENGKGRCWRCDLKVENEKPCRLSCQKRDP
jgi:Zn finger protein HypA/HybF involved in hydrogenase expression